MIGKHYWRQVHKLGVCDIAVWVDEDWRTLQREGAEVSEVEALTGVEFDFLVIAALAEETAEKISGKLILEGVPERKILWKAPLEL